MTFKTCITKLLKKISQHSRIFVRCTYLQKNTMRKISNKVFLYWCYVCSEWIESSQSICAESSFSSISFHGAMFPPNCLFWVFEWQYKSCFYCTVHSPACKFARSRAHRLFPNVKNEDFCWAAILHHLILILLLLVLSKEFNKNALLQIQQNFLESRLILYAGPD